MIDSTGERNMVHTYGEMPDSLYLKPFLPLLSFLWRVYKEQGWKGVDNYKAMGDQAIYDFFETRLNESIFTVKAVLDGKIAHPENVISYIIMIPSLTIRSDLVIGAQRLFGGDSTDITFAVVHDYNAELLVLLNCHIENGIPVDWYMVRQDDEILDRRHMKYGYKLREIPQRTKDMTRAAQLLTDVLKDIRNERMPQFTNAEYFVGTVVSSWSINLLCIPSNYESIAETFDGRASKEAYGLPDYTFSLYPFPTALNMFFLKGRSQFCRTLASITSNMDFYIQPFEEKNLELIRTRVPDLFSVYKNMVENEGVPFPIQTIDCKYPNIKSKDPNIRFEKAYPKGHFLTPADLNLSLEEFLRGVLLDVNDDTPVQKIDSSKIKSIGIGRNTVSK